MTNTTTEGRVLTPHELARVLAEYARIVEHNTTPGWNALAAVRDDEDGETMWEIWQTANDLLDLGPEELADVSRDALQDLLEVWRKLIPTS